MPYAPSGSNGNKPMNILNGNLQKELHSCINTAYTKKYCGKNVAKKKDLHGNKTNFVRKLNSDSLKTEINLNNINRAVP
jgi:hypothetical protein